MKNKNIKEKAIPDNVPSGKVKPIIVSNEFIEACESAGVSKSLISKVKKSNAEILKKSKKIIENLTVRDLIKFLSNKSIPQDAIIAYDDEKLDNPWEAPLIDGLTLLDTKDNKKVVVLYNNGSIVKLGKVK